MKRVFVLKNGFWLEVNPYNLQGSGVYLFF